MNKKIQISTPNAPSAIGAYSQAIRVDKLIFISGQIPLNPKTMEVVDGEFDIQIKQVLINLKAIVDEAGANLKQVVKWIEKSSSVELLAIGIGHDVTRYYNKAIKIADVQDLGDVMINQLTDLFSEDKKRTIH